APLPSLPRISGLLAIGPEVRFEHLDRQLRLLMTTAGRHVSYQALESDRVLPVGWAYDVSIGGAQWPQSLRVPEQVRLLAPNGAPIEVYAGHEIQIRYLPVTADLLIVHL